MKFSDALAYLGATQSEMAETLGVSAATVSGWKKAGTVPPMVALLVRSERELYAHIEELQRENADLRAAIKVLRQC